MQSRAAAAATRQLQHLADAVENRAERPIAAQIGLQPVQEVSTARTVAHAEQPIGNRKDLYGRPLRKIVPKR